MGPKKDDKKKGQAGAGGLGAGPTVTISEDELNEAKSLPPINDFIFTTLYAFKMTRNQSRLKKAIAKQFTFTNPEDPDYSEEKAVKYRVIDQNQLLAQALSRGLVTDADITDLANMDAEKKRNVFAQCTVESVTAFQLSLRQKKRDQNMTSIPSDVDKVKAAEQDAPASQVDQVIMLKDFPNCLADAEALVSHGLSKLHGVYLIEELFMRDIDDDQEDEEVAKQQTQSQFGEKAASVEGSGGEQEVKPKEKLFNLLAERAQVFNDTVQINRLFKKQALDSELRQCMVKRMKFEGPANPMDLPTPPEDGSEPPPVDEELKAAQFKFYDEFSGTFKKQIDEVAESMQVFRAERTKAMQKVVQLWPLPIDPEAEEKKRLQQELRESREKERLAREEEERKAAEAAAKSKKGAKQAPPADMQDSGQKEGEQDLEDEEEEEPFKSQDDDPAKTFEFLEFKKVMSEIPASQTTVGSMLGAMVYQICQNNQKRHADAMDDKHYNKAMVSKKVSSMGLRKESCLMLKQAEAIEEEMGSFFDDALQNLRLEHSLVETDYKHQFKEQNGCDESIKSSPYMIVKSENDKIKLAGDLGVFKFGDGQAQDHLEKQTLENCQLPGLNNRLDMPEKATMRQAIREAAQNQIIKICKLPSTQTKRCLILKGFEKMMKRAMKERQFSFLDRNYVEEYHDSNTMRQVLSTALLQSRADIKTEYFGMEDGLLIALYFKNPPGRLLRKQWTASQKIFPDFQEWATYVNDPENKTDENDSREYYDIRADKVGLLNCRTKYSFPSDNSIIRVDKFQTGQKRIGESQIIKDNFIFGLQERKDVVRGKVEGEDELRNRDAKKFQDKRVDFWLVFENGVRLTIEMQEHQEADMENIPPSRLPSWLQKKIDHELKLQQKEEESSVDQQQMDSQMSQSPEALTNRDRSPKGQTGMQTENEDEQEQFRKTQQSAVTNQQSNASKKNDQDAVPQDGEGDGDGEGVREDEFVEQEDPELKDGALLFEGEHDLTKGAKLTFTFKEGLIVQVQPNGDVLQKMMDNKPMPKTHSKGSHLWRDGQTEEQTETQRLITTNSEIVRKMADGNIIIYFSDGSITSSDKRRGIWYTVNAQGVKRSRKLKGRIISDVETRLKTRTKIDPETNATLKIREDGVLLVDYIDQTSLIVMPDGTNILKKKRSDGEAGTITYITKDGYAPVRQTYDPVKARARTCIGPGGTDALMGKDLIMERTNTGKTTEVLLPDRTIVQSYLERQEINPITFCTSMIHIVRRDDYSVVKVRQDGEVVLITANERAYLNDIGKQIKEFGSKDYDYFFELFGIPNERRSGVYTANLDEGRLWTQDEEGNYFIVYANGDSVEKMSVSFNMDQLVEGIENKEPDSPRMKDGEFIEDECKFLPPPKSMAHPRLFFVRSDGTGAEYFNDEQLQHMFRTYDILRKDPDLIQSSNQISTSNESSITHVFIKKQHNSFNAQAFDVSAEFPKLPQTLELVNQTVSIPTEPVVECYTCKNILEFSRMDEESVEEFERALKKYTDMKEFQAQRADQLKIKPPDVITQAVAPLTEARMRSTGMGSTMMGSAISVTKKSSYLDASIEAQKVPRTKTMREVGNRLTDAVAEKAEELETERQNETLLTNRDLPIDEVTGFQKYTHSVELSFMQQLQLRIANERGIDVENLHGEEFKMLKDYKKFETKKEMLNDFHGMLQGDQDQHPVNSRNQQANHAVGNNSIMTIDDSSRDNQKASQHSQRAY